MAKKISNKNKLKRKMGTGEGANYKPFITTSEFNSIGTTTVIRDWKTGRGVHCLSQGEMYWYYLLRWDDNNIDIREQYPLNREETLAIADKLGVKHPGNNDYIMTTDFLVTKSDNTFHAYSIKTSRDSLKDRDLEILCIEKMYWKSKNIKYSLLFKTDANTIMVHNIRRIVEFYDNNSVFDNISRIKHDIAIKKINIDLSSVQITNDFLEKLLEVNVNEC